MSTVSAELVDAIAQQVAAIIGKRITVLEANMNIAIVELRSINDRLSRLESYRLAESFTPIPRPFGDHP